MKLKYKHGDLISAAQDGDVNCIAHCANCFNTMKSGIAPQIVKAFPRAGEVDQETIRGDHNKLGTYTLGVHMLDGWHGVGVFNLYGQYHYNGRQRGLRDLDYNALYNSLDAMTKNLLARGGVVMVGLPLLGSELAGGDWAVIEVMIKQTLVKAGIDVTIYVREVEKMPTWVKNYD